MNWRRILCRPLLAGLVLVSSALVSPVEAAATVARALDLPGLVSASESVIVADAISSLSRWERVGNQERIVTYTKVRVADAVVGSVEAGDEFEIRTLGGRVGELAQVVMGEAKLRAGETAMLFLTRSDTSAWRVVGMSQGYFPVRVDAAGTPRVAVGHRDLELLGAGQSAAKLVAGMELREAVALIRATRSKANAN